MTASTGQHVHAVTKIYKYDGKMPFVQMMLNMMVAMGILDRLPANSLYGWQGSPYSGWSAYNNPYLRALALRGVYPGYANNPFVRSPWLSSPWTQHRPNTGSALWSSPTWGVQPLDSGSSYRRPWSPFELNGWVNEPWEESAWNSGAETSKESSQPVVPVVQNFNYNVPENESRENSSPLRKLVPPKPSKKPPGKREGSSDSGKRYREKPCVTDFCGLKKPDLNGLWVAQNGEMLGVNDRRYLWSDGYSRYLSGQIKIQNEYLLTSVDELDTMMRFKYKIAGDHLLTLRPDGTISEFIRMPVNRYYNSYSNPGLEPGY